MASDERTHPQDGGRPQAGQSGRLCLDPPDFTWERARSWLSGLPGGRGLNIGYEAVDRHAAGERADMVALRCLDRSGAVQDITYAELQRRTSRFANALRRARHRPRRPRVLPAQPHRDLYVTALGALRNTERVRAAVLRVRARTDPRAPGPWRRQGAGDHPGAVPAQGGTDPRRPAGAASRPDRRRRNRAGAHRVVHVRTGLQPRTRSRSPPTDPEDLALLHFTSGTTGKPKGAVHVHEAVVAHHATARYALDLHPDDVFWCTADPGWVTGTSYGIIAPLAHGVTIVVDEADFDAERWYDMLAAPAGQRLVHGTDRASGC